MRSIFRPALASVLVVSLAHLSAAPRSFNVAAKTPTINALRAFQQSPKIVSARVKGKKLIVTGADFSPGAVLMIDGQKQKTKNDAASPTTMLIVKKGGKKIRAGEVTSLRVENSGGALSNEFGFFEGQTITIQDGDKTLTLRVGDRFLLFLKTPQYTWRVAQLDSTIVKQVEDAQLIEGAQGIFEAVGRGQTNLVAEGELPCHGENPPCQALTGGFILKIVVE